MNVTAPTNPVLAVLIPAFCIAGALLVLLSAVAMLRERDAFARINVLSPATGMGLPLIVVAGYVHKLALSGFSGAALVKLVVTLIALLIVSSVASNTLARAAYLSGSPVDPRTRPQELAHEPGTQDSDPPS